MKAMKFLIILLYVGLLLSYRKIDNSNEVLVPIFGDSIPKFDLSFSVVQVSPPGEYLVYKEPTFIQKIDSLTFTLKHNTVCDSNITVSKKYLKNIRQYYEPMTREIPAQYVTLLYDYNNGLNNNYEITEKSTIKPKNNKIILNIYDKNFYLVKVLDIEKNSSFDVMSLVDSSSKEVILYVKIESL